MRRRRRSRRLLGSGGSTGGQCAGHYGRGEQRSHNDRCPSADDDPLHDSAPTSVMLHCLYQSLCGQPQLGEPILDPAFSECLGASPNGLLCQVEGQILDRLDHPQPR